VTGVGRQLRSIREQRGQGLAEVADALRINIQYLEAIENDLPGELPPGPFARLYTQAYGEYLGVTVPGMEPPNGRLETPETLPVVPHPPPSAEETRQRRMVVRIGILMLAVTVAVLVVRTCG